MRGREEMNENGGRERARKRKRESSERGMVVKKSTGDRQAGRHLDRQIERYRKKRKIEIERERRKIKRKRNRGKGVA